MLAVPIMTTATARMGTDCSIDAGDNDEDDMPMLMKNISVQR